MTYLLLGYFLACFIPLFISSWRTAIFGLALQAGFVALLLARVHDPWTHPGTAIQIAELLFIRMIVLPALIAGTLKRFKTGPELDLIPANLVAWGIAIGLLILSYSMGQRLYPEDLYFALHLGTSAFALLASLLVLALQRNAIGQALGILLFESGISLFESQMQHSQPWFIQFGISLVFLGLIIVASRFLLHFRKLDQAPAQVTEEGDVL